MKENTIATFDESGLSATALAAVYDLGYEEPTPIQQQAIPVVLEGRDLIAAAKTGTGKTAAFALPTMDKLPYAGKGEGPVMVIVTPTRELAMQISEVCETIAKRTNHRVVTLLGGVSYTPQIKKLRSGCDIIIATPGRLLDLMRQHEADLDLVQVLVLDEADRMLDMGFWPQVSEIVDATPSERQTLLFSATIDRSQDKVMFSLLNHPEIIEISHRGDTADLVDQYIIWTGRREKPALLNAFIREKGGFRVIVFTKTKGGADNCTRRLCKIGIGAEAIHADRSQAQRQRALERFREGKTHVIVATDVLARGIDVPEVDYVVNYDLPMMPEDYVHRIGRTGRAGVAGYAVSFVTPDTKNLLRSIQKFIGEDIQVMEFKAGEDAYEPVGKDHALAASEEEHAPKRKDRDKKNGKKGGRKHDDRGGKKGGRKHDDREGARDDAPKGGKKKRKGNETNAEAKRARKQEGRDAEEQFMQGGRMPMKRNTGEHTYNYAAFVGGKDGDSFKSKDKKSAKPGRGSKDSFQKRDDRNDRGHGKKKDRGYAKGGNGAKGGHGKRDERGGRSEEFRGEERYRYDRSGDDRFNRHSNERFDRGGRGGKRSGSSRPQSTRPTHRTDGASRNEGRKPFKSKVGRGSGGGHASDANRGGRRGSERSGNFRGRR
ncbi:ATP-dependent RNA helicase rhlE [Slackia heliotrinireducens]|uniref:DNA/RNA helicase, superfamily II n=1 Tax=Slackia heliotrinireducens (strain ATCC 29202 / DSM 20476 / NCTC 11029 / RHS 1) TaxID=471855 RepID=C7N178_SLAHD|nr:DEAD/DEAH box helicase [Slackia heliotrinireducens]ACV23300.1 DNA/RNA helicase, superfamily II [Slackia heliotrinireducens DSM 20476]VEH02486.1 ATP-dependent RNA helicase rhlE [Slackia heliotrinireducens]